MTGLSNPSRQTVSRQSCGLHSLETEKKERKALAAVKAVVVAIVYLQLKLKEVVLELRTLEKLIFRCVQLCQDIIPGRAVINSRAEC